MAPRTSHQKALAADPAYVYSYLPAIRMEMRQGHWAEAAQTVKQLLKLSPSADAEAWYDLAFADEQLGRHLEGEESARKGIADDPYHLVPEMERLLGTMFARRLTRWRPSTGAPT